MFDLGSANAWLFSEKCKDENCPAMNKKYSESKSKEFKENPNAEQILKYGKGAVKGHPSVDKACFDAGGQHCM